MSGDPANDVLMWLVILFSGLSARRAERDQRYGLAWWLWIAQENGEVSPHWRLDGEDSIKTRGHVNKRDGHGHTRHLTNQAESDAVKQRGDRFSDAAPGTLCHADGKSSARKRASAMIAKIPYRLALYIAEAYR